MARSHAGGRRGLAAPQEQATTRRLKTAAGTPSAPKQLPSAKSDSAEMRTGQEWKNGLHKRSWSEVRRQSGRGRWLRRAGDHLEHSTFCAGASSPITLRSPLPLRRAARKRPQVVHREACSRAKTGLRLRPAESPAAAAERDQGAPEMTFAQGLAKALLGISEQEKKAGERRGCECDDAHTQQCAESEERGQTTTQTSTGGALRHWGPPGPGAEGRRPLSSQWASGTGGGPGDP